VFIEMSTRTDHNGVIVYCLMCTHNKPSADL